MDSPELRLAGFEVVDSPTTIRTPCLNLGEFEEDASPLQNTYCTHMTEEEYEQKGASTTEQALKSLIDHLESDPEQLLKVLRRRKQEELEHSGLVSMLKSKFMLRVQGDKYKKKLVSKEECEEKLTELSQGMLMVYNYSLENKGTRFSKRLAARRAANSALDTTPKSKVSARNPRTKKPSTVPPPPPPPLPINLSGAGCLGVKSGPPPPPPVPPPVLTPLRDKTTAVLNTPEVEELKRKPIRNGSTGSLVSVHEELLSSNPLLKLRPVKQSRSPGGTPAKRFRGLNSSCGSVDLTTPRGLKNQEPLAQVFFRIMEQKFRNIRSPSPANSPRDTTAYSPGDFSP